MRKVTILRGPLKDRSYISELLTVQGNRGYYQSIGLGELSVDLKEATNIEDASNFQDKFDETYTYDKVKFGVNKRVYDRSFIDKENILVAENKTHFQIAYKFPWGYELIIMVKSEHDYEIIRDDLQEMKNKKQWGGVVSYCEKKIKKNPKNPKWYEEIALVYEYKNKPIQAIYYRRLKKENCNETN